MEETNIEGGTVFKNNKSERIAISQEDILQCVHFKMKKREKNKQEMKVKLHK